MSCWYLCVAKLPEMYCENCVSNEETSVTLDKKGLEELVSNATSCRMELEKRTRCLSGHCLLIWRTH